MRLGKILTHLRILLLLIIFLSLNRSAHKWAKAALPTTVVVSSEDNASGSADRNTTKTLAYTERKLSRGKRYLDFVKGTRLSWRIIIKNNILKVNTLWAYAYGFRTNYPMPNKEDRLRPFNKRDLFHTMERFLDKHGFDGRACVLKSYCSLMQGEHAQQGPGDGGGMLWKTLQLMFRLNSDDSKVVSYLNFENCQQILYSHCPLSFDRLSPYTDLI